MTGIRNDQFMRNFEQSTVMSPEEKSKADETAAKKGKGDVGGPHGGGDVHNYTPSGDYASANDNVMSVVAQAMMYAYDSDAHQLENQSNQMQAQNQLATEIADAENTIQTASTQSGGGDVDIIVVPDDSYNVNTTSGDGSFAYISQSAASALSANGVNIDADTTEPWSEQTMVSGDDVSGLLSQIGNVSQDLSGQSEWQMLQLQMTSNNLQQTGNEVTSSVKAIGTALKGASQF